MAEPQIVEQYVETSQQKAIREWLEKQITESPNALQAAARTIVGLVTTLIGLLLGVLAVSDDPLPAYFWLPGVRPLGVAAVMVLLAALCAALIVILPRRWSVALYQPDEQAALFHSLLARKSRWLTGAAIAFGVGIVLLGIILIVALLQAL